MMINLRSSKYIKSTKFRTYFCLNVFIPIFISVFKESTSVFCCCLESRLSYNHVHNRFRVTGKLVSKSYLLLPEERVKLSFDFSLGEIHLVWGKVICRKKEIELLYFQRLPKKRAGSDISKYKDIFPP